MRALSIILLFAWSAFNSCNSISIYKQSINLKSEIIEFEKAKVKIQHESDDWKIAFYARTDRLNFMNKLYIECFNDAKKFSEKLRNIIQKK